MNVGSKSGYPSSALSNFAPHRFQFDGVDCWSMEGLLQAFKFDKIPIQQEVCSLVGIAAKMRGKHRNQHWQQRQTLWWNGKEYPRDSTDYQLLLDRAYMALATNNSFRKALVASGDAVFTHSIGRRKESETVLTINEFCSRLTWIRQLIKDGKI